MSLLGKYVFRTLVVAITCTGVQGAVYANYNMDSPSDGSITATDASQIENLRKKSRPKVLHLPGQNIFQTFKSPIIELDVSATPLSIKIQTLFDAVDSGDRQKISAALATGIDPNIKNMQGQIALNQAVTARNLNVAQALIAAGANPNRTGLGGFLPLQHAVIAQDTNMMAVLIRGGADLQAIGAQRQTALVTAAQNGYVAGITLLAKQGADIDFGFDARRAAIEPALVAAARAGRLEACRLLLQLGADPHVEDASGQPAMVYAIRNNDAAMVRLLVAAAANATTTTDKRFSTDWAFE